MNIRMVDTISQYEKIQAEIDTKVQEVVRSGSYINGPWVHEFRKNLATFLGAKHVVACGNGTDALQIALMALGMEPGDEIITPSFTFIATVEVIALLRLRPVFVDVDPQTFNLDPAKIEAAITDRTRAIMPVHLFGQAADMEPVMAIARKHKLKVVEDTAQAIGGTYTFSDGTSARAGLIGDVGSTSFYPSKNLGAYGDGGAIFTQDESLAATLQMICNHGSSKRYFHDSIGVNSRLDSIQAAILDIKLKHLERYNRSRREAASMYDAALADCNELEIPFRASNAQHVFHQYTVKLKAGRTVRDGIREKMNEFGIPTMVYYPVPCHLQTAYQAYGYREGDLPVTERLAGEVLSLPMHSEMNESQIQYITEHLKKALKSFETFINS